MSGGLVVKRKYSILVAVALVVILLDQWVKIYIHTHFQLGETVRVIENFFNLTYVRNFGAAFGFLSESHPQFREAFFLSIPPIACSVILWMLRKIDDNDLIQILPLSAIFGGAIGNYIDRLRFRYVIDFLDFHLGGRYSWPAFNIADSAIVVGVMVLLIWGNSKETPSVAKQN
jgi:signal peptidase II